MREKPADGDWYGWSDFVKLAEREGYGEHPDDWGAWWECWKAGYSSAMNRA